MTWNYRILRHAAGWCAIHEVYYDEKGRPTSCSENPQDLSGSSVEELGASLKLIARAFEDAVLEYDSFVNRPSAMGAK
jgi:hypothetical protein